MNVTTGPSRVTITEKLSITWRWPAPAEGHNCHAKYCPRACPPERLCCPRHWFMAPKALRDAVWRNYRPGQCDDKRPSEAWHKAADAHIAAVWARELEVLETAERALALAWPASDNVLAWESCKSVTEQILRIASKGLGMTLAATMDQTRRTVVIMMQVAQGRGRT